ncbi:MAG: outer membrane beta-barrel protein [Deltaproteobacteria bacterium]|nr:outer membrane beta-barrel protein [Deltaproteobacteria bacterium]
MRSTIHIAFVFLLLVWLTPLLAESQGDDYKGITDPFGDPSTYEFSEDEKDDKEFFHLGRFLMIGIDFGAGLFTGGLGRSVEPGFLVGGKLVYFFDRSLAMEIGVHYSHHLDAVRGLNNFTVDIDTAMIPITFGILYYFNTQNAPKAIAIANPYIGLGGGAYMRRQTAATAAAGLANSASGTHFGGWLAGGLEFPIYRKHIYLGIDARFHLIFFNDEDDTFNGNIEAGDRAGDYFTPAVTLTYSF